MRPSEWIKYHPEFDVGCFCDSCDFINGMTVNSKGWRVCKKCGKPWHVQLNNCEVCGELFFNPALPPRRKFGIEKELRFAMPGHCDE